MDKAAGRRRVRYHYADRETPACLLLGRGSSGDAGAVLVLVVIVLPQVVLVLGVEA